MSFRPLSYAALGAGLLVLCGCSAVYQDAEGRKHYIGMMDLAIDGPAQDGSAAIMSRSVGLSLFSRLQGESGIALGYSETVLLTVPDGACIDLRAPGLCSTHKGENP